jgi:hypothetical protein
MCLCTVRGVRPEPVEGSRELAERSKDAPLTTTHQSNGAPSTFDGFRMSSVAIVFDLGQTCHDDHCRRTVYTVNRNPVIERIVTTASPIDLATIADVCDVDDFIDERPLFPATRSGSLAI